MLASITGGKHVRNHGQPVRLGERRDLPALGDAPGPDDIGLHDVHCTSRNQLSEAGQGGLCLISGVPAD